VPRKLPRLHNPQNATYTLHSTCMRLAFKRLNAPADGTTIWLYMAIYIWPGFGPAALICSPTATPTPWAAIFKFIYAETCIDGLHVYCSPVVVLHLQFPFPFPFPVQKTQIKNSRNWQANWTIGNEPRCRGALHLINIYSNWAASPQGHCPPRLLLFGSCKNKMKMFCGFRPKDAWHHFSTFQ